MPARKPISIGTRFARLVVISEGIRHPKGFRYKCLCDCGSETEVAGYKLSSNHTRSCGCLQQNSIPLGTQFTRLVVVERAAPFNRPNEKRQRPQVLCRCDCGNSIIVQEVNLKCGGTRSCGCLQQEVRRSTRWMIHGKSSSPEFSSWAHMLERCYNPKHDSYHRYGGRGITVCEDWRTSFLQFFKDMGTAPEGFTIGRIDNDGNYEPSNCRWESQKDQMRNTSRNRIIEFKGQSKCLIAWAEAYGLKNYVVAYRLDKLKWSIRRALETPPPKSRNRLNADDKSAYPQEAP